MREVSVSTEIASPPERVFVLVGDVTRMGEWSPETTACHWLGDASGPSVGARFRGSNQRSWRRWSTTCTVTDATPGRRFAFRVAFGPLAIAEWSYDFTPTQAGCRVTESWTDRRAGWMRVGARPLMGVADQAEHNRAGMAATLAALKAAAEA